MTRNESNMSAQAVAWLSLCVVLFGTQVLLENFPGAALAAAESNDLDANQVYAKRASWAESMIATRDNCALWAKGAKEGQVAATPLAAVWAKIEADWPTHAAWFRQDLPGDRYLDWFLQSNVNPHFERWIMSLALPRVAGTGAVLTHELDALVRDNIPTSDMRWLELYARTRRLEDLLATIRPIWLGDLRGDFERQAQELVSTQASSHDPRWAALQEWADRCRVPGKKLHMGTIAELPTTLALLAQALPQAHQDLKALVDELQAEPDSDVAFLNDARAALANSQYYMTWLMRLEGVPRDLWEPEIESSRQLNCMLAESSEAAGDLSEAQRHREDLEASIRLARLDDTELQGLPLPSQ